MNILNVFLYWKQYGITIKPFIYLYEENNDYYWIRIINFFI